MFTKDVHYSPDLEAAVLGACLLEKAAFGVALGIVSEESFYFDANKKVFKAMKEMFDATIPINLLTVADYLINKLKTPVLANYNADYYTTRLTNHVVCSTDLEYHSAIIKRMWMEREVIKMTHGGLSLDGSVTNKIIQLQTAIHKINSGEYVSDWQDMSTMMINLIKHQETMKVNQGMGLPTGIRVLDRENGGLFPGQSIILAARPSVGKSAFMGQMAISMAKLGKTVGIISLEMENNETVARLSAIESDIDYKIIYRNLFFDEKQRELWYNKIRDYVGLPIFISDKIGVNPSQIRAMAAKLKAKEGLDCLFIDYLQLVTPDGDGNKNRNRENELSSLSRATKTMAKELGIPVITLAQLNRAVTHRTGANRYPNLSDLRESGSIEQDADVVMFLHRDWTMGDQYLVDEKGESTENKADLIVRKWRNGASNIHIALDFDGPKMRFSEKKSSTWVPIKSGDLFEKANGDQE